jgi:hypothetical protein
VHRLRDDSLQSLFRKLIFGSLVHVEAQLGWTARSSLEFNAVFDGRFCFYWPEA